MFYQGNGNAFSKLIIKIGAGLFIWITGIAILCSLGLYAIISLLVGTALA